ncbi:MAG: guanylate kinase [Deltaproteobacteria bacterium CG_4_10_14_3_um_filter_51_14]|nr:MAG: guanylate kinase [Deltaproteobacteria bacterium CG_4_10_14_3_um_filter_51_14]
MGGSLFVVSGPSGSGKSTILAMVRKNISGLGYSISHTTRKPRGTEADGKEYYFVTREVFEEMLGKGLFLETADNYGCLYGTSRSSVERQLERGLDIIMDVDHRGAFGIRKRYGAARLIYLLPPSLDALRDRLLKRGSDSPEAVKKRLSMALDEMANCFSYDYIVINNDLEAATTDLASIILSERCRLDKKSPLVRELFPGLAIDDSKKTKS